MKLTCEMLRDLLPLYRDGVCSPDSRRAVEEHLADCPACQAELQLLEEELLLSAPAAELSGARAALRARKQLILRGAAAILLLLALWAGVFAGWHWLGTVSETDTNGMARQAADYLGDGPVEITEIRRRGNYLAALCRAEDGRGAICMFDRDTVFSDRWYANGGACWIHPGELDVWNFGSPQKEAVLTFGGGSLPAEARWYTFTFAGIIYTCPIRDGAVLDLFVIPDGRGSSSTPPVLLDENMEPLE